MLRGLLVLVDDQTAPGLLICDWCFLRLVDVFFVKVAEFGDVFADQGAVGIPFFAKGDRRVAAEELREEGSAA